MHLQPAGFNYVDPNWKPLTADIPALKDNEPRELGYGGRYYQKRCYDKFSGKRKTILISPTGSGKSLVQVFNAAREIIETDYQQKQVFIVPQLNIGTGFSEYRHRKLNVEGEIYDWEITTNCCVDSGYPVARIKKFLLTEHPCKSYRATKVLGGCTAVVSYASILAAFNKMTVAEQIQSIKNTSFRPDEVHHIAGADEGEVAANRLGGFCKLVMNEGGCLHLTTATFFRGDQQIILGNEYMKQFEVFRVPFMEHWNTLGLHSLHQEYHCYKDGNDLLKQLVEAISLEPKEPPIIIVPSDKMKFFKHTDKWVWVTKLVGELNKIFGANKVLDLVSPDRQKKDKERLVADEQDFSSFVTCQIGREGTDWPACSRIYNTVLDANVLQPVQKLGRALRQDKNKFDVKMINYIESFDDWNDAPDKIRERLSDRFNSVIAASMMDDMFYPINMPKLPKKKNEEEEDEDTDDEIKEVSLEDVYGSLRNELIENMLERYWSVPIDERTAESIDEIINEVIEEYREDMQEDVADDVLKNRLRMEFVRLYNPNKVELRMPGISVDYIRENGWDKVFQKDVLPNSPFLGSVGTKDFEELRKFLVNSADENKRILLEMARNGEPRPVAHKHILGERLCTYTNSNNDYYDKKFDNTIRELKPDWFINEVNIKKLKLLEKAKNGDKKPKIKEDLYEALNSYTRKRKGRDCYDGDFDRDLRKLRPDWFANTADKNRKELLDMAKENKNKPNLKTSLGQSLHRYMNSKGDCYNEEFCEEIKKLQPGWFVNTADENREKLLNMAKDGIERPSRGKNPLGKALTTYTSSKSNSYNADFDKEIRALRPDWFKK